MNIARIPRLSSISARTGRSLGLAAFLIALGSSGLQNATAEGDTRTISFHHIHTEEDLTITYKVNGQYDEEALKKIDRELRDWRRDETIHMDPHLIDLVWEVHRDVGSKEPIWVVCGYRSPETNSMLRQRSNGVAKFSQHMLGKAMDFYIPGVPLEKLRAVGLYLQKGGVGFYPTSGSPFVHLDTGSVRHWPSIAANEMPRWMAEGREIHVAAEAAPDTAGNRQALAVAKVSGGRASSSNSSSKEPVRTADAGSEPPRQAPVAKPAAKPVVNVAVEVERPGAVAAPPAKPKAQPTPAAPATYEVASAESRPVQLRPAQAASLVPPPAPSANDVINQRLDYWGGLQTADATSAPQLPANPPARAPAQAAKPKAQPAPAAEPEATASIAPWPLPGRDTRALAYAEPNVQAASPRAAAPMGGTTVRPVAPPDTTVAVKRTGDRPSVIANPPPVVAAGPGNSKTNDHLADPWLRALIVSPSVQSFMSASTFGAPDYRSLSSYLKKPTAAVVMTFTDDPQPALATDRFSGSAVVFVPTVTFGTRTASLR
jgi:uncharacterized protein YcbK (DUF882 family)